MIALMLALAVAPWSRPPSFQPLTGWQSGASGNTRSVYVGRKNLAAAPLESAAWIARGVRYVDRATADPPNKTLRGLPKNAVIVWAVIYGNDTLAKDEPPIHLRLGMAKRYACCEAVRIPAEYDLTGSGPHHAYSVIVRIYLGSPPNPRLRARAQQALQHLRLPAPR